MSQGRKREVIPFDWKDEDMFLEPTPTYEREVDPPVIPPQPHPSSLVQPRRVSTSVHVAPTSEITGKPRSTVALSQQESPRSSRATVHSGHNSSSMSQATPAPKLRASPESLLKKQEQANEATQVGRSSHVEQHPRVDQPAFHKSMSAQASYEQQMAQPSVALHNQQAQVVSDGGLPGDIRALRATINSLPKHGDGMPLKKALKSHPELKDEIQKGTGLLKKYTSKLRPYLNDPRVFSREMWRYLSEPDQSRIQHNYDLD